MKQSFTLIFCLATLGLFAQNTISGEILNHNEVTPIQNALLNFSGETANSDMAGAYSFSTSEDAGQLSLSKVADYSFGLDVLDMLAIRAFVLNQSDLNPYQQIAADLNDTGAVTTLDLVILRSLILDTETSFNVTDNWIFFPADVDANQSYTYPIDIDFATDGANQTQDFIGVKKGDVVISAAFDTESDVNLSLAQAGCGEQISVFLQGENFVNIAGIQFALNWNPEKLEFINAQGFLNDFNQTNINEDEADLGILRIAHNVQALSDIEDFADGEPIIRFDFLVTGDISDETISFADEIVPSLAVTENFLYANSEFNNLDLSTTGENFQVDVQIINASGSNNNDGAILLNISGGIAPFNFTLDGDPIDAELVNLAPGIYTLTITDASGCTTTVTAVISTTTNTQEVPEVDFAQLQKNAVTTGELLSLRLEANSSDLELKVVNTLGMVMLQQTISATDVLNLNAPQVAGQYWIYLENEQGRQVLPLIVY